MVAAVAYRPAGAVRLDRGVSVIIVNWRTPHLVADCLRSLLDEAQRFRRFSTIVVDNDSRDGSAETIERLIADNGWADWARLIRAPSNGGFASGNNIGLRQLHALDTPPEFVLLLNPDTYIRPGAVAELAGFLATHGAVGIAGSRAENPDGTPQYSCFRFPTVLSELAGQLNLGVVDWLLRKRIVRMHIPEEPCRVDWVSGGAMMFRRNLIEQIGLLDEAYFLYFEETDFTIRANRAGWQCWHVPQSRIVHLVGQSSGIDPRKNRPTPLPDYWFESRRRYFLLNHGLAYALATDLAVVLGGCFAYLRALLQGRRDRLPPRFLRDFIRHSTWVKGRRGLAPRRIAQ
jgi:GT2 family glycosyltransferase